MRENICYNSRRSETRADMRFNGHKAKHLLLEQFRGWRAQETAWLVFCVGSIAALSVYWNSDAAGTIAATTGMMYTVLAGKGKVSCFLFGLVNTPLYALIAFKAGYYGDFALNAYYFAMMFPALRAWLDNASAVSDEGIKRTRLSSKGRMALAAVSVACIVPVWAVLSAAGGSRPLCDAATSVLSIAAMALTVRRAIEEWALWIAVNAIEVFMWYKAWRGGEGDVSILLMWILFLANGIYLLSLWIGVERRARTR